MFVVLLVALVCSNAIVTFNLVGDETTTPPDDATGYRDISTFTRALQLIRQDYVNADKVGYRDLIYSAMRGMLETLDPHSQFMEPEDYSAMQDDTRGDFGGIGVVVSLRDGGLTVVSPMEGTPGFEAGLLPGDQIIKINGTSTDKMDLTSAVSLLRGEPGKPVTLTTLRPATSEIKDHEIVREIIPVDSVHDAELLDQAKTGGMKIGYVRVTQFSQPTAGELKQAITDLQAQGMAALILDLRYNPGGLLNSARDVCALFVDPGQMVVYTEGRLPSQRATYRTPTNYEPPPKFPMAVLINNGSASGSEIVAGALKDLNRALVVGETSFGKGSVQSVIELNDGSALRLTTAKYYTPGRQVIHEKGVEPHIRVTLTPDQERDALLLRRLKFLSDEQKEAAADAVDIQLERAIDALRALQVYAGTVDNGQLAGLDAGIVPVPSEADSE